MNNQRILKYVPMVSILALTLSADETMAMRRAGKLGCEVVKRVMPRLAPFTEKRGAGVDVQTQVARAKLLHSYHIKGKPLVLRNVWDAGSAKVVGTKDSVVATSSWAVAAAHGYDDGEKIPMHLVLENLERITDVVEVPVTFDMEGGYALDPVKVGEFTTMIINVGAVGVNFEDQVVGGEGLHEIPFQCERISAISSAAHKAGVPDFFINARTDVFFKDGPDHTHELVAEALKRARAYAEAGAHGFFVPGLVDLSLITQLCSESPLPINIMLLGHEPSVEQLIAAGVSRISYGPGPYIKMSEIFKLDGQ